jgi:hypothetical protein
MGTVGLPIYFNAASEKNARPRGHDGYRTAFNASINRGTVFSVSPARLARPEPAI